MKFWDSSALVPLLIEQPVSGSVGEISDLDPDLAFWWGSRVECVSALCRLEREGAIKQRQVELALGNLSGILKMGTEIQPSETLQETAIRLLRMHPLRAADAMQLAAAILASEGHPPSMDFVCLDARLTVAASKEGFPVLPTSI